MVLQDTEWLDPYVLDLNQPFRQWAAEAWVRKGGKLHRDLWLPWKLKMAIGKSGIVRCADSFIKHRKRLIVSVCGRVEYFCWPHNYTHEIVPLVWDCWPKYWDDLVRFVKRNKVRNVFCTSSQTAEMLACMVPAVESVWLPEGIPVEKYPMGGGMASREVDVLEVGRVAGAFTSAITRLCDSGAVYKCSTNGKLLFPTLDDYKNGLRNAKMVVCYPRCDTHPEQAGNIETLTQRYWECMLSGAVPIGRAPQELTRVCGYNPVIELGNDPAFATLSALHDAEKLESMARRNRDCAEQVSSWDLRIETMIKVLEKQSVM